MKRLLGLFVVLVLMCSCATVGKIVVDEQYRADGTIERKITTKEIDSTIMKTKATPGFGTSDNNTMGGFSARLLEPIPIKVDAGFVKRVEKQTPIVKPTSTEYYDETGKLTHIVKVDEQLGSQVSHTSFYPIKGISEIDDFVGTGKDLDKLYTEDTAKTILDVIPTLADTQLAINIKEGEVSETQAEKFSEILKEVLSKASEVLKKEGE